MAPSREIEKLQHRWQENPLGLTFAPLAEAYRKEGMLADALEMLEIGLTQHPSYVPAHIVRGRCFLDAKSDGQAEQAFLRVAELDPENVIALKSLADIAERAGRYTSAIERLEILLGFDRSNEDARLQLERLRAHQHIPMTGAVSLPADPVPVIAPAEPAAEAAAFGAPFPEPGSAEIPAVEVPVAEVPVVEAPVVEAPAAEGSAAEVPAVEEAGGAAAPEAPPEPPPASELPKAEIFVFRSEVEVEIFSPVELTAGPATEFQGPSDSESLVSGRAEAADLVERSEGATDQPSELAGEEVVIEEASLVVAADRDPEAEPQLVVTETMAEIFLRQGHLQLALAVYTQLLDRDPTNPRIQAAKEALEAEVRPAGGSALPAFAAVLTGGPSIRWYFENLLAARRPAAVASDGGVSLGEVFGDEQAAARPSGDQRPDPSFDEFYGDAAEPVAAPRLPEPPPADPAAEDLEQFTDWLKGLRR